jgi:Niemann-Pick C1 protein
MDFKFKKFAGRDEYLPAKGAIEHIVEAADLSSGEGYNTVWSKMFLYWIPHAVSKTEPILLTKELTFIYLLDY